MISLQSEDIQEFWNDEAKKTIVSGSKSDPILFALSGKLRPTCQRIIQDIFSKVQTKEKSLVVLKTDLWDEGIDNLMGRLVDFFPSEQKVNLIGIDISPIVCNNAKRRTHRKICVICADVRALPFQLDSIHIILDLSVLDNIPPAQHSMILDKYLQVLKRDGILVLIIETRSFLVNFRLRLQGLRKRLAFQPYRWLLDVDQTRALLRKKGFRTVKEQSIISTVIFPWDLTDSLSDINKVRSVCLATLSVLRRIEGSSLSKYFKSIAHFYVFVGKKRVS